jgi:CAAX prenyl protease-like protein
MRFFSAEKDKHQTIKAGNSLAMALLLPILVQLATMLIFSAFSSGFDWLYPLRISIVTAVLWYFRKLYRTLGWSLNWQAMAIGTIVFILWMLLEKDGNDGKTLLQGLEKLPSTWATIWLYFRFIGSSLIIPVVEELAFRGYLIRKLIDKDFENVQVGRFSWLSFIVSSILFGLLHDRWLAGTLAGMAYAGALYRRKNLSDAVIAHITTNTLIAITVLTQDRWGLWT